LATVIVIFTLGIHRYVASRSCPWIDADTSVVGADSIAVAVVVRTTTGGSVAVGSSSSLAVADSIGTVADSIAVAVVETTSDNSVAVAGQSVSVIVHSSEMSIEASGWTSSSSLVALKEAVGIHS